EFRSPPMGEAGHAHAAIGWARLHGGQAGGLESPQKAAGVAGVEAQAGTERPDLAAGYPDLPHEPVLAQRATAAEITIVERADSLRDHAVEAADVRNL